MTFPDEKYSVIGAFADDYFDRLAGAAASVDRDRLAQAAEMMARTYVAGGTVFACGNGGSAAISNHLHCDHLKGVQTDTNLKPKVVSLSATIETITAIANDISYDEIFAYQLRTLAEAGDLLVTVSSSGDSENVVRACRWAKDNGVATIAMTGFDGGRSGDIADINLHVDADNYGVIEDVHQSLMHILAQYVRQAQMDATVIAARKF
jgi:D-sedoheptulose 7-phosphate isomerase